MASGTPVGNMIIKVDLDSVGVEKSMTGLQRQLKSANKAMGAQLSAFNRSDRSASKYGVLIKGLSDRHKIQAQMVEEAKRKYDDMSNAYGENSVKAQKAAQDLNEQIARYQETGRELENVTAEFKEFQRVQDIQNSGWYKAADSLEQFGGKLQSAGKRMDETGQTLTRKVTLPLVAVGGIATKVGSDFEAGMSKVGAVSGASADDMEKLEAKAREMGATTVFSAKEASDAFYYMSLAGWDAEQSMDGIAGVMDLAAASGEDLALVSDIVTDGLTAFGLKAKDSARMADVLASASANANTDVNGLGNAFKYAAPVAGALGYSIEDTSKAIGLMSNAGIKGEKAGTALRTMMTNLASPTKGMKKQMDKLGISITDSEGNMKDLDTIMKDMRKSFKNLDKDQQAAAAATIFGKEAMSGALAIVNASESDYKKLSKAIAESEGSAKKMADVMQDNLQGSMKELRSMAEDLFITMYKNLKPTLESLVDGAKDLTQWFANLSPETQENIVKFGLLAAAAGPVLSMTGKLTTGIGGVMTGVGGLTKAIGLSKGVGLLGSLTALGPGAVAGVAVAGLAAVAGGIYLLNEHSKKAKEVNLELAQSFSDQATELENSADTFDELSNKAKVSNDELARLNDLNKRISESSNPGVIKELQKQYDELAKKSGLSKDELGRLFKANDEIIEQAPNVQKTVSDTGNAFLDNKDAADGARDAIAKYAQSLRDLSEQELTSQRLLLLAEYDEANKNLEKFEDRLNDINQLSEFIMNNSNMTKDDIANRIKQISELLNDDTLTNKEILALEQERSNLQDIKHQGMAKSYEALQKEKEGIEEQNKQWQDKIDKLDLVNQQMVNIKLANVGINGEGEKGLAQLDKSIAKNDKELAKLDDKLEANGKLTAEEQKRYDQLVETNEKQKEAKNDIFEEYGIYKDINSLAEGKLSLVDAEKQKKIESLAASSDIKVEEGNIVKQIEKKNAEHDKAIAKLEKQREKEGANKQEIDKQITALQNKKNVNDENIKKILEELGLWDKLDSEIKEGIYSEKEKGKAVDDTKSKLDSQGKQIDNNNKKTDEGIKKEQARTKEAGKNVDKKVTVKDAGTVASLNRKASEPKNKNVNLKAQGADEVNRIASSPVSKVVRLITKAAGGVKRAAGYAKGTPHKGHPGGDAVMGERGRELVHLPNGKSFLTPSKATFFPALPKGTHVIPNRKTESLLRGTPHYASGTSGWENALKQSELAKLLALNETNDSTVVVGGNRKRDEPNREEVSLLRKQVELLTELVLSSRNIEQKPVLSEGDIQRSYDRMDARESVKYNIFTGKPRRD